MSDLTEYARVRWTSARYTVFHERERTMVAGAPPPHSVGVVPYRLGPPRIADCQPDLAGSARRVAGRR